jgi:hypothetical protein
MTRSIMIGRVRKKWPRHDGHTEVVGVIMSGRSTPQATVKDIVAGHSPL